MADRRLTFDEAWKRVRARGSFQVVSSRGFAYAVTAEVLQEGRRAIVARPRSGRVVVHEDCWGADLTCQRTRAGGIYNGSPSIWDC